MPEILRNTSFSKGHMVQAIILFPLFKSKKVILKSMHLIKVSQQQMDSWNLNPYSLSSGTIGASSRTPCSYYLESNYLLSNYRIQFIYDQFRGHIGIVLTIAFAI